MTATPTPPATKVPSQKSIITTITLQCIPLVGAAGCAAEGATNQNFGIGIVFWLSILFWGFGYRYIGRMGRFTAALLIGPLFALSSCVASLKGVSYDYEHSYKYTDPNLGAYRQGLQSEIDSANRASFQEALTIVGAVLLLSVDAWRLAALHNARLQRSSFPSPLPVPVTPVLDESEVQAEETTGTER